MNKKLFFALGLILLVSGCINLGGTGVNQQKVETTNIITMQPSAVSVIPKPPVDVDTKFTVTFEIKNQETSKPITVNVNLFDWGVCKEAVLLCASSQDSTKPESKKCTLNLVPQQTELIEINSKAPTNAEIGGISNNCPIQWRASYTFSTVSNAGFNVLSKKKQIELDRAQKAVDLPATSSTVGTGPVKPYITFKTDKGYVTSGAPLQMVVQVRDESEGSFPEISPNQLSVTVPIEWYNALTNDEKPKACTDKFSVTAPAQGATTVIFKNKDKIPLISSQTYEMVCNFKGPDLDATNTPQKSYTVSSKLENYVYSIDGKQIVDIKP